MQYVGRAFDSVSKTWNSINPATLSGAIDVIVVENCEGELSCSPFHVRFGILQLLRPSQKKVDFIINGRMTNLPMKLGDGGEAFFVFEAGRDVDVPSELITSPVLSAASSPPNSPPASPPDGRLQEPEFLDIAEDNSGSAGKDPVTTDADTGVDVPSTVTSSDLIPSSPPSREATMEKVYNLSKRLTKINIPTKISHNGDLFLDMDGYKSSAKNIHENDELIRAVIEEEFGEGVDISQFFKEDSHGNLVFSTDDLQSTPSLLSSPYSDSSSELDQPVPSTSASTSNYVKTLRLTSDQLRLLDLKPGENDVCFSVDKGKAMINSKLYLWKHDVPIVISDIDGTITKSDALGHVLTMLGRDWTHPGVAKLFTDIALNGYNVMYLTARSVGQADSTRAYLRTIEQEGEKVPHGPVILSPDRTLAALKREVVLKKPEVFKMACLNDLKNLYGEKGTPFYAGFGNKITDALSYRSVGIPSSRIFTINPVGEVHMELLELAGYKSSYVYIDELVDHFFPPVNAGLVVDENYTDVNFWREPLPCLSDESDGEEYNEEEDVDYLENQDDAGNGGDDDDDDDDDDDEYNDEEEDGYDVDEEFSQDSEDFDNDVDDDLDADLLESPVSQRGGILPTMSEGSGQSVNHSPVAALRSSTSQSFVKASELMSQLKVDE